MLEPHHRHNVAAFLLDTAAVGGLTVVPLFVVTELGGGATMSGVIAGLQGALYTTVSLVSARFVSRAPKGVAWVAAGVPGFALLFCLAPLTRNPYAYGAASATGFGCLALVWPALWTWVGSDRDPKTRARRIGQYNLSWSAGVAAGPLLAGWLYGFDYRLAFLCVFVLAACALCIELTVRHDRTGLAVTDCPGPQGPEDYDRVNDSFLYSAWLANAFGWVMVGVSRSVYVKRVEELVESGRLALFFEQPGDGDFPLSLTGAFTWLVFLTCFSRAVVFLLMGRHLFWRGRFSIVAMLQFVAAGASWVLAHTAGFAVMMGCFLLIGCANGACFVASIEYSLANVNRRHRRAAINEATVGGGIFIGGTILGLLAGQFGVTWPFRWMPALAFAALAAELALLAYGRRTTQRPSHQP
ncbi:MAG TPA: MFS transporter [Candidatus Hydrogenedentes bacterium]|nr:MFS transporter [Candidatus Hydrogenedentota bacterium]